MRATRLLLLVALGLLVLLVQGKSAATTKPAECPEKLNIADLLLRAKMRLQETTMKLSALELVYKKYMNMTVTPDAEHVNNLKYLLAQLEIMKEQVQTMYKTKDITLTEMQDLLLLIKSIEEEILALLRQYQSAPLNLESLRLAMKELNVIINNLKALIRSLEDLLKNTKCPKPTQQCKWANSTMDMSVQCLNKQMDLEAKLKEARNKLRQAKDYLKYLIKQRKQKKRELKRLQSLIASLQGKVEMLKAQSTACANKPDPNTEINKEIEILRMLLQLVIKKQAAKKLSDTSATQIKAKLEYLIALLLKDQQANSLKRFLDCDLLKKALEQAEKDLIKAKQDAQALAQQIKALNEQIKAQRLAIQAMRNNVRAIKKELKELKKCCKKHIKRVKKTKKEQTVQQAPAKSSPASPKKQQVRAAPKKAKKVQPKRVKKSKKVRSKKNKKHAKKSQGKKKKQSHKKVAKKGAQKVKKTSSKKHK